MSLLFHNLLKSIAGSEGVPEPETNAYLQTVAQENGIVADPRFCDRIIKFCKSRNIWNNLRTCVGRPFGQKLRIDGDTKYVEKAYDLSPLGGHFTSPVFGGEPQVSNLGYWFNVRGMQGNENSLKALRNAEGFTGMVMYYPTIEGTLVTVYSDNNSNLQERTRFRNGPGTAMRLQVRVVDSDERFSAQPTYNLEGNQLFGGRVSGGITRVYSWGTEIFETSSFVSDSNFSDIDSSSRFWGSAGSSSDQLWNQESRLVVIFNTDIGEQNYNDLVALIQEYYEPNNVMTRLYGETFASTLTTDQETYAMDVLNDGYSASTFPYPTFAPNISLEFGDSIANPILTWTNPYDPLQVYDSYELQKSIDGGVTYTTIHTGNVLTFTDTTETQSNDNILYRVRGIFQDTQGSWSVPVTLEEPVVLSMDGEAWEINGEVLTTNE
jgi:hypothetical protein